MKHVLNKKKDVIPSDAVYVGRPSVWGNPFSHKDGTLAKFKVGGREEAISKHREWVMSQPEMIQKIRGELAGKQLVCWCKPLACHADTLWEIANGLPVWEYE